MISCVFARFNFLGFKKGVLLNSFFVILHIVMKQEMALEILKSGANVFLTGEPGAGKTHTIGRYIVWLREQGKSVAVTASTGIAASHLGGRTIHSWSGVGLSKVLTQGDVEDILKRNKSARRISDTEVLIIDEISMLSGVLLDTLDMLFQTIRLDQRPFGGMQIVLVGDFFQLPPVSKDKEEPRSFESEVWKQANLRTCYLTEQYRQEDILFLNLLRAVRGGAVEKKHHALLCEQNTISYEGREPTILHSHNREVDRDNILRLDALSGKEYVFEMDKEGPKHLVEMLVKGCISPESLKLKEGAMVMFTKNNPEQGFINGTLGTIVGFNSEYGLPTVETFDGRVIIAEQMNWDVSEDGEVVASIKQIPLRLAWSVTIHKSQGSSLDAAEINLSRVFVEGQGYVALSRVRTLGGLKITGHINTRALQIAPVILRQDAVFREQSERIEKWCMKNCNRVREEQKTFIT